MKTEEVFGHKAQLKDYDGDFPFTVVYYDIGSQEAKEMTITEEAYDEALKTFEDNDNVSESVIYKYISKHDTVKTEPYFNEN